MHLKQNRHSFGVLLIYTISTITLPSVGWCEPAAHSSQTNPHSAVNNGRGRVLTTTSPSGEVTERVQLGSRPGEQESGTPPYSEKNPETWDETTPNTSGERPGQRLKPRMVPSSSETSLTNRFTPRQTEQERVFSQHGPQNANCSKGNIKQVVQGKFYMAGLFEPNTPNLGYQSDSAVPVQAQGGQKRVRGQRVSGSVESWQKLHPVVECGDDAMTLTVRRKRAVLLLLDRANESSVPLSQLPPQCGYSVQTTWRDLSLMAQYDACYVTQEDDSYVLPLLWLGTPIKMSCPVSQIKPHTVGPSSLCCSPYGMTVKLQGLTATEELKIDVRGEWTSLALLVAQCGYTLDSQDGEFAITAPFVTCGITVKGGKYTLSLQIGKNIFTLACPVSPSEGLPITHQSQVGSLHLASREAKPSLGSLESFPLTPPYYLAPPYYPHPTYYYSYASPKVHHSYNLPTPTSLPPEPTLSSQTLPPADSQPGYQDYYSHQIPPRKQYEHFHSSLTSRDEMEDSSQVYPGQMQENQKQNEETPLLDLSEKHSATPTGFPAQAEALHVQPPGHDFSPYYHYYHHPKIPLSGPPQGPGPGSEVSGEQSLTNFKNHEFPVLPPNILPFPPHVIETNSYPYTFPTNPAFVHITPSLNVPYLLQPYLFNYFYYFPHIAMDNAKRLIGLHPGTTAKTNSSSVHSLLHSPTLSVHDKHNMNPYIHESNADKTINTGKHSPEWITHPVLLDNNKRLSASMNSAVQPQVPQSYSHGPNPLTVPLPEQPSFPSLPFIYNPDHYHHYYQTYYDYYRRYYGPEGLLSADSHVSSTSKTADPLLQAFSSPVQQPSNHKQPTPTPHAESAYDIQNELLHPYYYYYHHYYQPQVSKDNQQLHPAVSKDSEKAESESQHPSDFDVSMMEWFIHAAEAGYSGIPLPLQSPIHSLYSHYITQQPPYDPFLPPGGEEAVRDQLRTNTDTPFASPCGLGPVSDFDCSNSLGCCAHTVKDCAVGQYFVFAVPDSVVEPTVTPPAHSSEDSNVSCTLQRLASDLDIYTVPQDGCGVNKHMFGETVLHLLEVQGIHSYQDSNSAHTTSPVRLMVGCSSSSHSPGEVWFHVMNQPTLPPIQPTPATVTVQLRIATDESFASFHPEAHLPLSLMQGRPVYLEASLLEYPDPNLVLLVHSCLAYTQIPYASWIPVYDSCSSQGFSQLLPSPNSHHIRRIVISSFLALPPEGSPYTGKGYSLLQDPEIYFLCLTEVCSAADSDCTVRCLKGPNVDV